MTRVGNAKETHTPTIGAVFAERSVAEAAVEDLRRSGLADEHLGVAIHEPGDVVFEEDFEEEMTHKLELGVAVGAPIGAVAGMTVLALTVPGIGTLGVGGILVAGAVTGRWQEAFGEPTSASNPGRGRQKTCGTGSGSGSRRAR